MSIVDPSNNFENPTLYDLKYQNDRQQFFETHHLFLTLSINSIAENIFPLLDDVDGPCDDALKAFSFRYLEDREEYDYDRDEDDFISNLANFLRSDICKKDDNELLSEEYKSIYLSDIEGLASERINHIWNIKKEEILSEDALGDELYTLRRVLRLTDADKLSNYFLSKVWGWVSFLMNPLRGLSVKALYYDGEGASCLPIEHKRNIAREGKTALLFALIKSDSLHNIRQYITEVPAEVRYQMFNFDVRN